MLVADIFEVILVDSDGDVIGTTTLQDANIDVSVQENDVRGGRGDQLIGVLHSDRDINIALTDTLFKYEWLAKNLGQDIVTGAGVAYAMPKVYTAVDNASNIEFTLENEPLASDSGLKIFDSSGTEILLTTG